MTEAISGGIVRATKARRKDMLETLKQLMRDRGKARPSIPSKALRATTAARYALLCREVLCCLPSREELREAERQRRKRKFFLTKKQRGAERKAARNG